MGRRIGAPLVRAGGLVGLGGGGEVRDPASILGVNATGIWDDRSATFTGATWTNQAGGTHFTQGTGANQPPSGTAINGRPTIQPDGVADFMDAGAISGLLSASAFCVWAVVRPLGTLSAGPPTVTSAPLFVTDNAGYIALTCATDPRGICFDTAYRTTTATGTMVSGTVYQVRLRLDSGTLYYRLRNSGGVVGSEGSIACGNVGVMTGLLRLGRSYLSNYQQADIAAIYTANVAPNAGNLSAMDLWTFRRWGV